MKDDAYEDLLNTLKKRLLNNLPRHQGVDWTEVETKLKSTPDKQRIFEKMENSGGEPDVTGFDAGAQDFVFCDCSPETPGGRRSLCYGDAALNARNENKPAGSAVGSAEAMGIEILTEEMYRELQKNGEYDIKMSSLIKTPDEISKLGGALFCNRRYEHVFAYHNGAESYFSSCGFRGSLKV